MTHWCCVYQMVQYIADMLKKLLSLKLAQKLCIVPLGTSCNKILFHKSSILAVKMTIYWISYEVQKESQENLWPIANYFNFFLLKASVFKNSSRKKCTKRYNTDLIRVKRTIRRNPFRGEQFYHVRKDLKNKNFIC